MEIPQAPETSPEMQSWQILERIIPRGRAQTIAHYMHCSTDYVRRWMREPENQEGTGQPNPVDRVCHLIDSVFLVNPLGAAYIPEFISNHHRQLVRSHSAAGFESGERREVAAELLRRGVEAVNSLNVEGATESTLNQLIELIEKASQAKERIQAELAARPHESSPVPAAGPRRVSGQ